MEKRDVFGHGLSLRLKMGSSSRTINGSQLNRSQTNMPTDAYTLPVSFERTRAIFNERLSGNLDIGYLDLRHRTDVHREIALNLKHCLRPDNDDAIDEDGYSGATSPIGHPSFRAVSTFILRIWDRCKLSTHAGTFLCNQTFFVGATRQKTLNIYWCRFYSHTPLTDYTCAVSAIVNTLKAIQSQP